MTKTFLFLGCGSNRKDSITAGVADWNELRFDVNDSGSLTGHSPLMERGSLYMAHRCGFTEKVLSGTLQTLRFKRVASMMRGAPYVDLWALATKSDLN